MQVGSETRKLFEFNGRKIYCECLELELKGINDQGIWIWRAAKTARPGIAAEAAGGGVQKMSRTGLGYYIGRAGNFTRVRNEKLNGTDQNRFIHTFWFELATTLLHDENQNRFRGDLPYDPLLLSRSCSREEPRSSRSHQPQRHFQSTTHSTRPLPQVDPKSGRSHPLGHSYSNQDRGEDPRTR